MADRNTQTTDSYLSTEELKRTATDVLLAFDRFCSENGLTYWIGYGTLLGAIRHKGFIPWDDDIDVQMPIGDYRKLAELLRDTDGRFGEDGRYRLACGSIDHKASQHHIWFPKVYDTWTKCIWEPWFDKKVAPEQGVYIDIFPLVGYDPGKFKTRQAAAAICRSGMQDCFTATAKHAESLRGLLGRAKRTVNRLVGTRIWQCIHERIQNSLPEPSGCTFCITIGEKQRAYEAEWYRETIRVPIEGNLLPAPAGYERILETLYGDWRQLPPEEKRVQTHDHRFIRLNRQS